MKEYLLSLWSKFKNKSIIFKSFICLLLVIYIAIACVCIIQVEVDCTTPGTITNVSNVINIDSENKSGNIYTVSVYSKPKVSLIQYLFIKMDKNSEIEMGQSITYDIFTQNEEYISNVGYKNQSIQDSIIVAYESAIEDGYNVTLDYNYQGQYLINIPQNLFKTGAESFKNGDIVTKYNNIDFNNETDYYETLDDIFNNVLFNENPIKSYKDNNKFELLDKYGNKIEENIKLLFDIYEHLNKQETIYNFTVLRDGKEKEITVKLKTLFYLYSNFIIKNNKLYTIKNNNFTSYKINYDKCNPKINISKTTSVGPSGGLLQTLAVYNSITDKDITNGKKVMGTGGITTKGLVTSIGGEKQKIVTANLYLADVFFIPSQNYNSAKEMFDKLNETSFELISVTSFRDVLNYFNKSEVK